MDRWMLFRLDLWILYLTHCLSSNILRDTCTRDAVFYHVLQGYRVVQEPLAVFDALFYTICLRSCVQHNRCRSVATNVKNKKIKCYLYSMDSYSSSMNFTTEAGWSYYDTGPPSKQVGPHCRSLPRDVCGGLRCTDSCTLSNYKCLTGRSCQDILERFGHLQLSNGVYQLQINQKKLDVYCDMEGYGGGWIMVSNVYIKSRDPVVLKTFNKYNANLNDISKYKEDFVLGPNGFKELWELVNFTQIRFQCRKSNPGRLFHVFTNNSLIINWYLDRKGYVVKACGSFYRFNDDTSKLSRFCEKWGFNGIFGPSRNLYEGAMWIMNKYHWNTYPTITEFRYECDDFDRQREKLSVGDFWKVYVK